MTFVKDSENGLSKRKYVNWYNLKPVPICPKCGTICKVGTVEQLSDGSRIQHRYCSECPHSIKIPIPPQSELK